MKKFGDCEEPGGRGTKRKRGKYMKMSTLISCWCCRTMWWKFQKFMLFFFILMIFCNLLPIIFPAACLTCESNGVSNNRWGVSTLPPSLTVAIFMQRTSISFKEGAPSPERNWRGRIPSVRWPSLRTSFHRSCSAEWWYLLPVRSENKPKKLSQKTDHPFALCRYWTYLESQFPRIFRIKIIEGCTTGLGSCRTARCFILR